MAKELEAFLTWLLSGKTLKDFPGGGRTFQRQSLALWQYWALPPIIDEVHDVIYVDGIHLGRKAVVLIAQNDQHVLGWYVARSEKAQAWQALMERIAPPLLVVTDGGSGFEKARQKTWPTTRVQRCTFHAFMNIRSATTTRPRLQAGKELYTLGKRLLRIHRREQASIWVKDYIAWTLRWQDFLAQRTITPEGGWVYTHVRLVQARNTLNRLISSETLFTFLDPTWEREMPAMTNRIEGATNAPLRQMLRDHRGLSLTRRIKAIFWWCYMHTEHPLPPAQILKTMPRDADIEAAYQHITQPDIKTAILPQWGEAITWQDLHHNTRPYTNPWD